MPSSTLINIQNREIKLSNLDKILYPAGFTKEQVIDYYIRVAPTLLPHLSNRPLTLKRYPHGTRESFFYQKKCPSFRPSWMSISMVWSEKNHQSISFCTVNDLPSLVWVANLASLELHTSLSLAKNTKIPTMLVFDLDPGLSVGMIECCHVAVILRDWLQNMNLTSYPKTSGSKGLQVYVPLNTSVTYEQTKKFAHTVAKLMENKYPTLVVSKMTKSLRKGKVFIDWSQNDFHKTTVCVYSLRAAQNFPTVSTPVSWQEVELVSQTKNQDLITFTPDQVLKRIQELGDLFAPVLSHHQTLKKIVYDS